MLAGQGTPCFLENLLLADAKSSGVLVPGLNNSLISNG